LKHPYAIDNTGDTSVAPRAGAWIETNISVISSQPVIVAPRAGAWIETLYICSLYRLTEVAPRAGAWIETRNFASNYHFLVSRPARARGLKLLFPVKIQHLY